MPARRAREPSGGASAREMMTSVASTDASSSESECARSLCQAGQADRGLGRVDEVNRPRRVPRRQKEVSRVARLLGSVAIAGPALASDHEPRERRNGRRQFSSAVEARGSVSGQAGAQESLSGLPVDYQPH